jgi:SAM-dependent methyltransferase
MTETPSVARHLHINLAEYDTRIRTFVPYYEEMLNQVGRTLITLQPTAPVILDLGIGTGALSDACLAAIPEASIIGIDTDPGMMDMARRRLSRLGDRLRLHEGSFLAMPLPECDVIVASLALHHVKTPAEKQELYRRCHDALRPGGLMLIADCMTPGPDALREQGMEHWLAHLAATYGPDEARNYLTAWADEDTYFAVSDETDWLQAVGFAVDVIWRIDLFAVVLARVV